VSGAKPLPKRFLGVRGGAIILAAAGGLWVIASLAGIDAATTVVIEGALALAAVVFAVVGLFLVVGRDWVAPDTSSRLPAWMANAREKGGIAWFNAVVVSAVVFAGTGVLFTYGWLGTIAQYLDGNVSQVEAVVVADLGSSRRNLCWRRVTLSVTSWGARHNVCLARSLRPSLAIGDVRTGQLVLFRYRQTALGKVAIAIKPVAVE
jgi:hypothetical protein